MSALNYNEKKLQRGNAECLAAFNYLKDATAMNFYQKLQGFENLNSLNERAVTKTLHVSLNFDPSEKLSNDKLVNIAFSYMQKIGFGDQPFLIYKHLDAGHPHLHIVSTTITCTGTRINTHNLGRNQSEKARKEIEIYFKLVQAEKQNKVSEKQLQPIQISGACYGKDETRKSIAKIVSYVFREYNFTSLPEFNAVLRQFNVIADRGKEDSRIYTKHGLIYRLLDAHGNKTGVPIKASLLPLKPTLGKLEEQFFINQSSRDPLRQKIKSVIDESLESNSNSFFEFTAALLEKKINILKRVNEEGRWYGITFIDNKKKSVFNGSEIGKNYSVAALQNRFEKQSPVIDTSLNKQNLIIRSPNTERSVLHNDQTKELSIVKNEETILNNLLEVQKEYTNTPFQLLKKKRKKKSK